MKQKFMAEMLAKDILSVLEAHSLETGAFGISLTISGPQFDAIATEFPDHQPGMVLIRNGNGIQWYVKILRQRSAEDFPPNSHFESTN